MNLVSYEVKNGTKVRFPQFNKDEVLNLKVENDKVYNVNNSVIVYIEDGKIYSLPYTIEAIRELQNNGFTNNGNLYVPFSNWDYPLHDTKTWENVFNRKVS